MALGCVCLECHGQWVEGEGLLKPLVLGDHGRVHAVLVKKKHRFLEQGDCGVPGRPLCLLLLLGPLCILRELCAGRWGSHG